MKTRRVLAGVAAGVFIAATMVAGAQAVPNTVVFTERSSGYDCFRIPAVVEAPNGDLLAFAEARRGGAKFCADKADVDLVYKRSTNGGRSWGPLTVVLDGKGDTRGNPAPIVDTERGRIVLLSTWQCHTSPACGRRPHVQYSDDSGRTWSDPRELTAELGFDSPPRWFATGPGHQLQLTRGAHAGRLVAGVNYENGDGKAGALIYSDDSGETWRRGATDVPGSAITPQELSLVELTDGRVYAAARNQATNGDKCLDGGRRNRAEAISSDGGQSFSTRFRFEPDLITPVVQSSTLRLRGTHEGDRYNRILFAGPSTCDRRKELVIRSSFDEGGNWQSVGQGTLVWGQDAAYSDMVLVNDDTVGVLYEAGPAGNANETIRWSALTESDLGHPDGDTSGLPVTPDSSPHGNDAWLRGASLGPGRFGKAASLDGNDHVQLPFAESLATGSGDFTWSGWFNYGASKSSQALLWAYNMGANFSQLWLRAEPGNGRIRAWAENGPSGSVAADAPRAYDDRKWHHFALRRHGGTIRLYIDGTLAGSASGLQSSVSPGRPFRIHLGQRLDGANRLRGSLDDVRLYGRALSEAEIGELATSAGGPTAGLRLHLPFDTEGAADAHR